MRKVCKKCYSKTDWYYEIPIEYTQKSIIICGGCINYYTDHKVRYLNKEKKFLFKLVSAVPSAVQKKDTARQCPNNGHEIEETPEDWD